MAESIWIEKYRPRDFNDIVGQRHLIPRIRAFVEQKNMPHLLFAGPAGTGKTSTALVIARAFFGDEWKQNFLELNASDERGIDVIRVKVKDFARTRAIGDVPFKIIYLDECDQLTRDAQQALRRTMENYTQTCRFILSCNYSSKILDPIQSRCAIFRFKPLEREEIMGIIGKIAVNEGLKIDENAKTAICEASEGDVRRLENLMQSCAAMGSKITEEMVFSVASIAKPKEIRKILELAVKNDFIGARKMLLDVMLNYGFSGLDIIRHIQSEILNLDIPDKAKMGLMEKTGEAEFRMTEGSDEFIQLEALLASFALASGK
ncbi:replication factor C small subunit [Candidatus Woesearchaeota archaeon]|nr:replication factor C small subunit [Candidatus Woesearchaeota archaeon]